MRPGPTALPEQDVPPPRVVTGTPKVRATPRAASTSSIDFGNTIANGGMRYRPASVEKRARDPVDVSTSPSTASVRTRRNSGSIWPTAACRVAVPFFGAGSIGVDDECPVVGAGSHVTLIGESSHELVFSQSVAYFLAPMRESVCSPRGTACDEALNLRGIIGRNSY